MYVLENEFNFTEILYDLNFVIKTCYRGHYKPYYLKDTLSLQFKADKISGKIFFKEVCYDLNI